MKISVCCPSYKRPKVETLDYIPFVKVYVDNKEVGDYQRENTGFLGNIIGVGEGIQGNVSRIRNYIIREELKENDGVLIIDDDLKGIYFWEGRSKNLVSPEMLKTMLVKYSVRQKIRGLSMGNKCQS